MTSSITPPAHLTLHSLMPLIVIVACISRRSDIAGGAAYTNRLSDELGATALLVSVRPAHRHYGSQATPASLAWGGQPCARTPRVPRRAVRADNAVQADGASDALRASRGRQHHTAQSVISKALINTLRGLIATVV